VFLLTRHYMSSPRYLQATAVCSFDRHGHLLGPQPTASRPRKPIDHKLNKLTHAQCRVAVSQRLITEAAAGFLMSWTSGTLPRETRPQNYKYLVLRWDGISEAPRSRQPIAYDGLTAEPNVIVVLIEDDDGNELDVGDDDEVVASDSESVAAMVLTG